MSPRSTVAAGVALLLFLLVGWLSFRRIEALVGDTGLVEHTYQVLDCLNATMQAVTGAQTDMAAFIRSGDPQDLPPYREHAAEATASLNGLEQLVADNPVQARRLPALRAAVGARLELLDRESDIRQRAGAPEALAFARTNAPRRTMETVRQSIQQMRDTELALLSQRVGSSKTSTRFALIALVTLILIGTILLATAAILLRGQFQTLVKFNQQLESENAQRRRVEAELKEKAAALERSNADLENFAYVASHDLQEPLRMVASYTELLGRRYQGRLDQDADDFIGFAVGGAKRMQALINDLLQYARITRDAASASERVDLASVVDEVLRVFDTTIQEAGAHVSCGPLPTVDGSSTQLRQLWQNLIGNALKFRRSDRAPMVRIAAVREGGDWHMSVGDNGIGIPPESAERVFLIFQRLHSQDAYSGTGIGLAICKKIVERHGGRIWVAQAEDGGAVFHFTLPATRAAS